MNRTRKDVQLEKKLAAYALAGAAVLTPGVAKAGTVYFPNVNQTVNQPGNYIFNLSGASSADITIQAQSIVGFGGDPNNEVAAATASGGQVFMSGSNVAALAFGTLIDPTNPANFGAGGKMYGYDTVPGGFSGGNWSSSGGDAYLGFYFQGTGGPHAGWADIATSANAGGASFTVLSYAYETNANALITAGQTTDTPEPSTLALIALGGAGLIALRRRRAANA